MKKRSPKKLSLNRETLLGLDDKSLLEAAAGSCETCLTGTCGCDDPWRFMGGEA